MLVNVQVHVSKGQVWIEIPQAKLKVNIPDIVACETSTRQIVALGQTADEIKAEAPDQWERHSNQIEFRPAFDTNRFEPELTVTVLRYYASKAQARIRPGLIVRFLGLYIDQFHYDLEIPGYGNLLTKTQNKLVRLLRTLPCMRRCTVNGKRVLGR